MKLDVHPGKNFALLFTEEIALAWGDLPPKQWPEEIVKKFHLAVDIASRQEGRPYSDWDADTQYQYNLVRPRTLKESVDNIINRPGDPKVDLTENVLSSLGGFAAGLWRSDFRSNLSNFSSMTGFEDFKKLTQKVAGLPSVPSCIKLAKVDPTADEPDAVVMVNLPPELNRPEYRQPSVPRDSAGNFLIQQSLMALKTLQGLNGQVELANMQGQLFNLWQSINVMKENYPGSPFNTYGDEGLLEPMRDLFYEIFYSNPDSVLRQLFPSTLLVENNLAVVSQVIDLGILHQMSVQLQKFELDDPELTDLVLSLVRAGSSVSMPDLLKFLLTQEPHSGELKDQMIWKVLELMYGASPEESAKIKQLLFHLMAALHRVDGWNRSQQASGGYGVADHALRRGLEVLNQSGEQLFTARLPKRGAPVSEPPSELALKQVLTSDWIGHLAEGFYRVMSNQTAGGSEALDRSTRWTRLFKSALADPAPGVTPLPVHAVSLLTLLLEDAQAWDALLQIVDKMSLISNRPAYQGLGLSSYGDEFLDFIEGKSSHTSIRASQKFAQKLRGQVAGLFDSGGDNSSNIMNEFLIFAYHNPESVAQLLNVFSQSVENGQLLEFLKVIRRSLPESSQ
jgi:hypothetical protein